MSPRSKEDPMTRGSSLRWTIVAMIAVASLFNYIDRQSLSLLAGPVQRDLAISEAGYANLVNAFLAAYTIGNAVTAWLVVKIGARLGLAFWVGWWSIACAAGGLAQNSFQLGVTRFALGLGETGNWTAAPVLVRQWFAASQRGLAIGIYTAAAMLGATIAPPLITGFGTALGWRATFIIIGVAGLVWVAAWLLLYPAAAEREVVEQDSADDAAGETSWGAVLRSRRVWLIAVAGMFASPVWYFYLFWFPKYLTDERGLALVDLGRTAWVPYLAAGLGALIGGVLSGRLIARGTAPPRARLIVMTAVAVAAPISAVNMLAPPVAISLAVAAVVGFSHFLWTTNITALVVDLFPARNLGRVFGVMGILAGLGGILTTHLIGQLVEITSYRPMFGVMALAYLAALIAALLAVGRRGDAAITSAQPAT